MQMSLLIVDDDSAILDGMVTLLIQAGDATYPAPSGEAVLCSLSPDSPLGSVYSHFDILSKAVLLLYPHLKYIFP